MVTGRHMTEQNLLKLDLGCGPNKCGPEFVGVDRREFPGVDIVADLRAQWPWQDGTVDFVHCSHFIEHLEPAERIHFANELWRVLKPGGTAVLIAPHWSSCRAYGDLTHKWPPVSEFWPPYLNAEWRKVNAPHNDEYKCDFVNGVGFGLRADVAVRAQDYQQYAMANFKEAAQDIHINLTKPA
jgi:SAM-dependent methyltransferase